MANRPKGLERLKRAKEEGLDAVCLDETAVRAPLNATVCNNVERIEDSDVIHIEKKQPEHEKKAVDEIQLYRYVSAVEPTDAYNEPEIGADQP